MQRAAPTSILCLAPTAAAALACGGAAVAPPEPPGEVVEVSPLPLGWDATVEPAAARLRAAPPGLECRGATTWWRFEPGDRFVVQTKDARSGGEWHALGEDLGWISHEARLEDTACTAARWLDVGEGSVVLCAEGPLGCGVEIATAVEVVDRGADPAELERLGRAVGGLRAFGGGVTFRTADEPRPGRSVRYRAAAHQRLAEAVAAELGVAAQEDPAARSPVLIELGRD